MRKVVLLGLFSVEVAAYYNATTDSENIVCVYPLSGQYGLLNRILFYALWVAVFLFKKWTWPAVGAIVYVMTYTATAAFHAFLLAILSKNKLYDLDVVGTWAILSFSSILAGLLAWYSNSIRHSAYRPIYGFWCTFIAAGTICSAIAMYSDYPQEAACYSNPGQSNASTLLTAPTDLLSAGQYNCSYQCFRTLQPMRHPKDITIVAAPRLFSGLFTFQIATVLLTAAFGVWWSIWGCILVGDRKRTRAELKKSKRTIAHSTTLKAQRNAAAIRRRAERELRTGKYQQTRNFFLFINPIVLPVIMVFNEIYILKPTSLPSSDPVFVVGQWGSWVTIGLSLIAAAINAKYEYRWKELQTIFATDQEEFELEKQENSKPKIKFDLERAFGQPLQNWSSSALEEGLKHLPPPKPVVDLTRIPHYFNSGERLRVRTRLPLEYQPPFPVGDLAVMPIIQNDQVCQAYQDWEPGMDGIIVRDIYGHDWLVQKGMLWHRELWEQAEVLPR